MASFSSKLKLISVVSVRISGRLAVLHKSSVALDVLHTHMITLKRVKPYISVRFSTVNTTSTMTWSKGHTQKRVKQKKQTQ